MRFKLFLCLFVCCSVLLAGCEKNNPDPKPTEAARTVLVYLAADNSLSHFALNDLKEMKAGMEGVGNANVHLLVYIDTGNSPKLVELKYKKGEGVEELVKSYEDRNSVGVEETKEVFGDVFSNEAYKAKSYGLVYWSHGDGWIPNPLLSSRWIGQDTGSGTNYMNISDLVSILSSAAPHFDFVLFDACFMQSIEVAYALRSVFNYDQRDDWQGMVGYFDMVQMMRKLVDDEGFAVWKQAYDAALSYWKTTPKNFSASGGMFSMEGSNGVSHYIPTPLETAAARAYRSTDWYNAAGLEQLGW